MKTSLEYGRIGEAQAENCLHALAAANHRQWAKWEGHVVPLMERGDEYSLNELEAGNLPGKLMDQLVADANTVIQLLEQIVDDFAWAVSADELVQRKIQQLISWLTYARGCSPDVFARWKIQCRTPFLRLTPREQRSDYSEAVLDLQSIASAGGLVLPVPLPEVTPLEGWAATRRRLRHKCGMHSPYMVAEYSRSKICQACLASMSYSY